MKKLLFLLLIISKVHAQSICVSVDCKDTIKYPATTVSLNGLVTSGEGVKSVKWTVTAGTATIDSPNIQVTVARGLSQPITYVFLLTGTSTKGAVGTAFDSVVYIPNKPPQAICGPTINDTTTTAFLSGSNSTDPEGLPLNFNWVQASGPNTATITTTTMANPIVTNLINGTYIFGLTVKDSGGLTSTSTQIVNVALPVVQIKTVIVTTVVTTKYYSDGTSKTTTTTNTVTTVP